jgi:hypothetical protein
MQVNSNLKKMSDDAEGIQRPDPVPFYRNKVYIAMIVLLGFVGLGYFVSKGAIGWEIKKITNLFSQFIILIKCMLESIRLTAYTAMVLHGKVKRPEYLRLIFV